MIGDSTVSVLGRRELGGQVVGERVPRIYIMVCVYRSVGPAVAGLACFLHFNPNSMLKHELQQVFFA